MRKLKSTPEVFSLKNYFQRAQLTLVRSRSEIGKSVVIEGNIMIETSVEATQ